MTKSYDLFLVSASVLCCIFTTICVAETPDKPGWKLVWSDEFNGMKIDRSHWSFEKGFVRNKEPQYYTDREKNAYIENGNLVIETLREDFEGAPYTSAGLHTRGKQVFQYGRIEMRAKLPSGNAVWPAFWTLGAEGRHPDCGEIDIMELWGGPNGFWGKNKEKGWGDGVCNTTAHWGEGGQSARSEGRIHALPEGKKYSDDYHIFAIEWDENEIVWFIDDIEIDRMKIETKGQKHCFRRPHYLLVNTAVSPEKVAQMKPEDLPAHFYIDYIRVYQKSNSLALEEDSVTM